MDRELSDKIEAALMETLRGFSVASGREDCCPYCQGDGYGADIITSTVENGTLHAYMRCGNCDGIFSFSIEDYE